MIFTNNAISRSTIGLFSLVLAGCAGNQGVSEDALTPRLTGDVRALGHSTSEERAHLQLIATDLVAALVQIPEMRPVTATLQINAPQTAYGSAIIRALEEAGFGLQLVSADQGRNFVSYSKRLSETESGLVTDYALAVGKVRLSREYTVRNGAVYPSSLLKISGTDYIGDIQLADAIFAEQGGQATAFISGAQREGVPDLDLKARTIDVDEQDKLPQEARTRQEAVFAEARQHYFETQTNRNVPNLERFTKHRRTVLIFDDNETQLMGSANKNAVRLIVREFKSNDIMVIKACLAADGRDDASMSRAIRVEEELAGFGIPTESSYIAPCARSSYRHTSDNSPTPVELIHYRRQ